MLLDAIDTDTEFLCNFLIFLIIKKNTPSEWF